MTTAGVRFVLFISLIGLFAGLITGSTIYYRLFYFGTLVIVLSWIWSKYSIEGIKLERKARMLRAQVGQIFEERYEINNTGILPRFWVSVINDSPLPLAPGSRVIPLIEGRRSRSYLARTRLIQRGIFPLGPTIIESGDPFGLFPRRKTFPSSSSLIVYPMVFEVATLPNPPGALTGGEFVRRRTTQVTPNASSVRDYAPGDPLNRIHWVSTAKRQRLMSKEFELDPRADVWVILDAMQSVQYIIHSEMEKVPSVLFVRTSTRIPLPPSTEEYIASIAASISRYYLKQGRSVGLAFAGRTLIVLPPERGSRQLGKILESLALFRADGEIPIHGVVEIQMHSLTRGNIIVLITPSVHQEVIYVADRLKRRGFHPMAILIDASSFNGPSGTEELYAQLNLSSIPTLRIRYGDDLSNLFSSPSPFS